MLYSLSCVRIGGDIPSDTGGRYGVTQSFSFVYPSAPDDDAKGYRALYNCFGYCFGYNVGGTQELRNSLNFSRVDDGMINDTPDREKYANCMITIKYIGKYRGANSPLTYQFNLPNQRIDEIPEVIEAKLRQVWNADPTTPPFPQNPPKPEYDDIMNDFVVTNAICVIGG